MPTKKAYQTVSEKKTVPAKFHAVAPSGNPYKTYRVITPENSQHYKTKAVKVEKIIIRFR